MAIEAVSRDEEPTRMVPRPAASRSSVWWGGMASVDSTGPQESFRSPGRISQNWLIDMEAGDWSADTDQSFVAETDNRLEKAWDFWLDAAAQENKPQATTKPEARKEDCMFSSEGF
eukprot:s761_g4.t1